MSSNENNLTYAPYTLDREKQINRLAQDTSKDDFEMSVSSNEHNVSILCSTGFYSVVAIPAFEKIDKDFTMSITNHTVTCVDVIKKLDKSNASVNSVLYFRVVNHHDDLTAKVTIHLHHTTRRIQVQGGSFVNRQKRAAVWLVENFILLAFKNVSKAC